MTFYYSYIYRPLQKLMHRFNIHHTRDMPGLVELNKLDSEYIFLPTKCEWCGIQGKLMMKRPEFERRSRRWSTSWNLTR